jgi:hypothetical protein
MRATIAGRGEHPSGGRGLGALNRKPQALQGLITRTLWIAPAGFRKLDDFSSDSLTNWIGVVGERAERRKRHLKGNAHETEGFPVEVYR